MSKQDYETLKKFYPNTVDKMEQVVNSGTYVNPEEMIDSNYTPVWLANLIRGAATYINRRERNKKRD